MKPWARATLGGERLVTLAKEQGYQSGSGVLNVIRRLERQAAADPALATKLKGLRERFDETVREE